MSAPATEPADAIRIVELDEVDSTNAEAMRRAATGERGPLWILGHRQTRGRGRSGRSWQSAPGNLAATLLFEPGCPSSVLHQLSLLAGVAVHDGICDLAARGPCRVQDASRRLQLKWPNDILLEGGKLGGILIESTSLGAGTVAAIGIGINVAAAPCVPGRASACLAGMGVTAAPRAVLEAISTALADWLARWSRGREFEQIRRAWLERAAAPSSPMSINTGEGTISGTFAGLDETGALLLTCRSATGASDTIRRFTFGDVTLASERSADLGKD